jgi:hypothetical protein
MIFLSPCTTPRSPEAQQDPIEETRSTVREASQTEGIGAVHWTETKGGPPPFGGSMNDEDAPDALRQERNSQLYWESVGQGVAGRQSHVHDRRGPWPDREIGRFLLHRSAVWRAPDFAAA